MLKIQNLPAFTRTLDQQAEAVDSLIRNRVRRVVSEALRRMIIKTPVQTGAAVASYLASTGAPQYIDHPGWSPTPGTNNMPLGGEPNRAQAEAAALATLDNLDLSDPYAMHYIANGSDHIAELEMGLLPSSDRSRAPAGMLGVTVAELQTLLQSGKI